MYDNEPLPEAGPVESEIALLASASVYDVAAPVESIVNTPPAPTVILIPVPA